LDRCGAGRTASAPCSPPGRPERRRWSALAGRPTAYASSSAMPPPKLSSRRKTFLGFQPPAVGDEEIAAVTDAIRSGWLTTGPRAAEAERRLAVYTGGAHPPAV